MTDSRNRTKFRYQAWAFLRWRRKQGGKVESIRGKKGSQALREFNALPPLDKVFAANDRRGRSW